MCALQIFIIIYYYYHLYILAHYNIFRTNIGFNNIPNYVFLHSFKYKLPHTKTTVYCDDDNDDGDPDGWGRQGDMPP